jgi:RimJ/RimL family protein N-acetyltransferase
VSLAALPGMMSELLVVGKLVHPGNSGEIVNFLGSQIRKAGLAYDLAQAQWGKGLMSQAVSAVLDWTFGQAQVDRVHAFVRVDNKRSGRLLERGGFVREGCLRSYRVCRGEARDYYIYGLLRQDWLKVHPPNGADPASAG